MGTKYSSQSTSGYNASPPSDDGTAVSSNEVKWSFIKTKLADILKTFGEDINTAILTHTDESVLDKAVTYTTVAADHKRTINVTAAATQSLGDAATMATGYIVTVKNSHTAAITVDLATGADTLDGTAAGSVSLNPDAAMTFIVNDAADGYLTKSIVQPDDATFVGEVIVGGAVEVLGPVVSAGDDAIGASSSQGLQISGTGSTNDLTGLNSSAAVAWRVPTGTQDFVVEGDLTVGGDLQPKIKIVDIGDWNMDDNGSNPTTVAHGLTAANIRSIDVVIRNDDATLYAPLSAPSAQGTTPDGRWEWDATNVTMYRDATGRFDDTDHDATSYNRGWITISYV